MIGRSEEWDKLLNAFEATKNGGRFVLIEGEAGIGKTRLAQEFTAHLQARGTAMVNAVCFEGESDLAYGPFLNGLMPLLIQPQNLARLANTSVHWLSEATRLFPELAQVMPGIPTPTPLDDPGARVRFYEGLRQVIISLLAGPTAGVLLIDDIQWADAASIDFLTYIARRLSSSELFILGTCRDEVLASRGELRHLILDLGRVGVLSRLPLRRFNALEVAALVVSLVSFKGDIHEVADHLYRESEGLPFIAVEYLKALAEQSDAQVSELPVLPGSVRDLLHSRLVDLDETGRQLLASGAVIGRSFDFQLLRDASGRSEIEVISGLEALLVSGLIVERGDGERR
jgi:predicted ATPase